MCDSEDGMITAEWYYNKSLVQQIKCKSCYKKYKFFQNKIRFWTIPKKKTPWENITKINDL